MRQSAAWAGWVRQLLNNVVTECAGAAFSQRDSEGGMQVHISQALHGAEHVHKVALLPRLCVRCRIGIASGQIAVGFTGVLAAQGQTEGIAETVNHIENSNSATGSARWIKFAIAGSKLTQGQVGINQTGTDIGGNASQSGDGAAGVVVCQRVNNSAQRAFGRCQAAVQAGLLFGFAEQTNQWRKRASFCTCVGVTACQR